MPDARRVRGRPDHHRRTVDDRHRADVDHHRAHARRARADRLPDGCRRRDPQRAALGHRAPAMPGASTSRADVQPFAPFMGEPVPVVTKADFETHGVHRGPPARRPARRMARRVERRGRRSAICCAPASRSSTPTTTASTRSPTSAASAPYYDAELRSADDIVATGSRRAHRRCCPAGHRRPRPGRRRHQHRATWPPTVAKLTRNLSGEGRFRWLHARPGAADDLLDDGHGGARRRRPG